MNYFEFEMKTILNEQNAKRRILEMNGRKKKITTYKIEYGQLSTFSSQILKRMKCQKQNNKFDDV